MHVVLALVVILTVMVLIARTRKTTRSCRWRAQKSGDRGSLRKYRCASCGAEAFTSLKGPPNQCRRGAEGPGL